MNIHEKYIKRCLQISKNALGMAAPNPMVGCVIVHQNKIISEGYTKSHGEAHAEVNAIAKVKDKALLKEAIIYVSLEPCSHYGKTPPCADLIIKHKIPKVVIGCLDPNPLVAGNGVKRLEKNGVEVIVGVLEKECKKHFKRFFTFINKKRPYIILKWAQSADGFIAPMTKERKEPVWISNRFSRQLTHKWRTEEQAIAVGAQTVIDDNPNLTARNWFGQNPTRIVIDPGKRVCKQHKVFNAESKTLHLPDISSSSTKVVSQIVEKLYDEKITSVIIEGGAKTINHFIEADLWDEARVFSTEAIIKSGIAAPKLYKEYAKILDVASDVLLIYERN